MDHWPLAWQCHADHAAVARLKHKYTMLKTLLIQTRQKMALTDPVLDKKAPPAEMYLAALQAELSTKSLEAGASLINQELSKAFLSLPPDNPFKSEFQREYLAEVGRTITQASEQIAHQEPFSTIIDYLAGERHRLATEYCHYPIAEFGRLRRNYATLFRTAVTQKNRYSYRLGTILDLIPEGYREYRFPAVFGSVIGTQWGDVLDGLTIWKDIEDQRVPLTTLLVCRRYCDDNGMEWLFGKWEVEYPSATILHMEIPYIPIVQRVCGSLFAQIQGLTCSQDELLAHLAHLHWYLAHGAFYDRGSAAIGEWLIKALCQYKGYTITWSLQPDLEALVAPDIDHFVVYYSTFAKLSHQTSNSR